MIINFIVLTFATIFLTLIGWLPYASFPDWINNSLDSITQFFIDWSFILPMTTIIYFVGFIVSVEMSILLLYFINSIIKIVRGSG